MKGIDFLKKINHVDQDMIAEAANPVKAGSRKWNIVKCAGLVACIAVFVSVILAGRLQEDKEVIRTEDMDTTSAEDTVEIRQETVPAIESADEVEHWTSMVMLDGKLYVCTGAESDIEVRNCIMDGVITSTVEEGYRPVEDNQSNFGTGYRYQYVDERSVDVYMDEKWIRFERYTVSVDETTLFSGSDQTDSTEEQITSQAASEWNSSTEEQTETTMVVETNQGSAAKEAAMTLDESTLTADSAWFQIFINGYEYACCGEPYRLERLENGVWTECALVNGDAVFTDIAWILEPGKETKFLLDWSGIYGTLEGGKYRIIKDVYVEDGTLELACEFEL